MSASEDRTKENTTIQKTGDFPVGFPMESPFEQEEEVHLRDYLRVVLRRKWTVITFFIIVVSTVAIATFMAKPIYKATAVVRIDREKSIKIGSSYEQDGWYDEEAYYQTQLKVLKSRSLAKRVVRSLKSGPISEISSLPGSAEAWQSPASEASLKQAGEEDPAARHIDGFIGGLLIEPEPKTRLVRVSYISEDPAFAATAANTTARSYIEFNMESKFDATQHAKEWLEKQLDEMKAKVERAEEAVNRYIAQNGIVLLTETAAASDRRDAPSQSIMSKKLSDLSSQLLQATADRISKESFYKEAMKESAEMSSAALSAHGIIQSLRREYATLEAEHAQLSKTYKPDYPKMVKLREQMNKIRDNITIEVKKALQALRFEYETAVKKEDALRAAFDKHRSETLTMNDKMVQYQILKRDADTNRELYNGLLEKLKEVGVTASITATNIMVLDRAEVPKGPFKPNKTKNLFLALIVGLFGGVGLAFFVEYLDNTVKTPEDIERTARLPSLGFVPAIAKKDAKDMSVHPRISFEGDNSPLSEAFRSIGTYIMFSSAVRPPKTILITSPQMGDGKTTISANLALTLAKSYGKCILVDADMRRPKLSKIFDVDNTTGLSSFLTGQVDFSLENGLVRKTGIEKLDLITHGVIPPDPSQLLSSYRMRDLINALYPFYSFIILDSPPLLGLSDSMILSTLVDGVIIVTKAGNTPKDAVSQSKKILQGLNAKILGVVLNDTKESHLKYGSYYHYYSYYYDSDGKGKKKRGRAKDIA